jgi:FAD/FMN-containing dehydrogenase
MTLHNLIAVALAFAPLVYGAPSTQDWANLNKTFSSRLRAVTPFAVPCFTLVNGRVVKADAELCSTVQQQYLSPSYRVDQFEAYQATQSEGCATAPGQQCLLDSSNPLNPAAYTNTSCNRGSLPAYSIQIATADDVKTAFAFASRTRATISIKNSGHDYNGRSSGPGSLSLWTRKIQNLSYEPSFVPVGCKNEKPLAAFTVGAGVNFAEVYAFANQQNVTYLGGSGATVGASGGWVMTGGHSILSRAYGLGIDRVLQYEIVTPDGVKRFANSCQNTDLFWALRGGGGATFGVVLSTTSRVEPKLEFSAAVITLPATASPQVQAEWFNLLVNSTIKWASEGWGGFQGVGISLVATPLLSLAEAQSSMANLASFAQANGGSVVIEAIPDFYTLFTKYFVPTTQPGGNAHFSHNWMIPSSAFNTPKGRQDLRDHMDWMASVGLAPGFLDTTPYLYSGKGSSKVKAYAYGPPSSVSSTPAWRDSAVILTSGIGWAYNSSVGDKRKVAATLREASDRAQKLWPNSGAYANEAHPWVNNWQSAFWGSNYKQLKALKQKYDPQGLLGCWHCVGSESGRNSDVVGGSCLGKLI